MNYTKENKITVEMVGEYRNLFSKKDERLPDVLVFRAQDRTLKEIAILMGVTKERVRQMEAKAVELMRYYHKILYFR